MNQGIRELVDHWLGSTSPDCTGVDLLIAGLALVSFHCHF